MPTDAFEMALVHDVFRRELKAVPKLIDSVHPGQHGRAMRIARHIANLMAALHHHHIAEDELVWPKLRARTPRYAEIIHRMETEHEFIAKSVFNVELRLANWTAAIAAATTEFGSQSQATVELINEVTALTALVGDHLHGEERLVVPLINESLTAAEWRAATERGASFISGRNIAFAIAFAGMTLESCTTEQRRRFLAGMPPPQRALVRLFAQRARAKYRARLGTG